MGLGFGEERIGKQIRRACNEAPWSAVNVMGSMNRFEKVNGSGWLEMVSGNLTAALAVFELWSSTSSSAMSRGGGWEPGKHAE